MARMTDSVRPLKQFLAIAIGALGISLGAWLKATLPGTEVPQTGQTLAILMVGIVLGPTCGALSVALYIGLGLVGLPVFAGGRSGPEVLFGPTAGYLVGFASAAVIAGFWSRSRAGARFDSALVGMFAAHGIILLLGWIRLAVDLGPDQAYQNGVAPFWTGAIVKSLIAAVLCRFVAHRRNNRRDDQC